MKKSLVVLGLSTLLLISVYTLTGKVDDSESLSKIEYKKVKVLKET